MNEPQVPTDPRAAFDLGRLFGQRRAFAAVVGRCSAANAQLLRRIHDEKLYLPIAPSWEIFCCTHLAITRRHADRLISLLNRFGPIYFELAQLVGISPEEYLAIEPAVREQTLILNGAAVTLIPENAPKIQEAVEELLHRSRRTRRFPRPPVSLRTRIVALAGQGRTIANRLVALYCSAHTASDRELILEVATEIRLILMQPDTE